MKKLLTLSLSLLVVSVSVVAQSTNEGVKVEMKKQIEPRPLIKIDKSKIKPAVRVESQSVKPAVQPINKEEEVKSIETKKK